jgi:hypothetical protein
MKRVLGRGGLALIAFHMGDDVIHVDDLFGATVSLDFRFHQPAAIVEALESNGFTVIERSEREPYPDVEHPSRRCYLLGRTK